MPQPRGCEELRQALARLGRGVVAHPPAELRAHLANCPTCGALVAAVGQVASRSGSASLYTPALRRRTLAAVRQAAPRRAAEPGWLLLPPAGLGALAGTMAPVWILARLLQALAVSQALAWALASVVVLSTSLAASGLVAILIDRLQGDWHALTGAARSSEV